MCALHAVVGPAAPRAALLACPRVGPGLGSRRVATALPARPPSAPRRGRGGGAAPCRAAAAAATAGFWPVLAAAYQVDPVGVLLSAAACVAASALAALLFTALPALLSAHRAARALEALARSLTAEVPDTAAAFRLSGLEIADAVGEVSSLGTDLTAGLRASVRAFSGVEGAARSAAAGAGPALRRATPVVCGALESALKTRAGMGYTEPTLAQAAAAAEKAGGVARRLRATVAGGRAVAGVASAAAAINRLRPRGARRRLQGRSDAELEGAGA